MSIAKKRQRNPVLRLSKKSFYQRRRPLLDFWSKVKACTHAIYLFHTLVSLSKITVMSLWSMGKVHTMTRNQRGLCSSLFKLINLGSSSSQGAELTVIYQEGSTIFQVLGLFLSSCRPAKWNQDKGGVFKSHPVKKGWGMVIPLFVAVDGDLVKGMVK